MNQLTRTFLISNKKGLHARTAALLVQVAGRYDASVYLSRNGIKTECDSILSVLTLACPQYSTITVEIMGNEAEQAMAEISALIKKGFGDKEE